MQSTSPVPTAGRYLVGDIAIDTRQRRILRPDGDVELTQRIFDLLIALVSDPDTLHTRETLLERVWGTTCIEDSNLTQSISVIRKALGETRKDWIRTVSSLLTTEDLYIHESAVGLIDEIPGYSWDDEAAERGEDKPIKENDHSCDALRYGLRTTEALWRPHLPTRLEVAA